MRTVHEFDKIKSRYYSKFPKRIEHDLTTLNLPPVKRINTSVFIYGEVNTGKTLLAAQLMMEEIKHVYLKAIPNVHNSILFVSFAEMLNEIRNTYTNGNTEEVMKKYLDSHFLVIDDFFTSKITDWVLEIIYHLINHRYEQMKLTVITSNTPLNMLEAILGDQRIISRIARSYKLIEKQTYKK